MKRFIFILSTFILIFSLSVPCFASSVVTRSFKDSVSAMPQFGENWSKFDDIIGSAVFLNGNEVSFVGMYYANNVANGQHIYVKSNDKSYTLYSSVLGSQVLTISLDESSITNTSFRNWFFENTELPNCDGSSCPATDVNGDNICDDCGMPFTFNLRNDVYNYNGVTLPQLPNFDREQYPYFFITRNETTGSSSLRVTSATLGYDSSKNAMVFTSSGKSIIYDFVEPSWVVRVESNVTEGATAAQPYSLVHWTNFDMKDETGNTLISGDPNFMPPLWEKILMVTQGEIPSAAGAVHGTMTTLTLCGVGLVALLVGLSLFGKVFQRYRS